MPHRATPSSAWFVDGIAYPAGSYYVTPTQARSDRAIDDVNSKYHQCASLRNIPHAIVEQSTGDPQILSVLHLQQISQRERYS